MNNEVKTAYIPFPGSEAADEKRKEELLAKIVTSLKNPPVVVESTESHSVIILDSISDIPIPKETDFSKLNKYQLDFLFTASLIVEKFKIGSSLIKNNGGPEIPNTDLINLLVSQGEQYVNIDKKLILEHIEKYGLSDKVIHKGKRQTIKKIDESGFILLKNNISTIEKCDGIIEENDISDDEIERDTPENEIRDMLGDDYNDNF